MFYLEKIEALTEVINNSIKKETHRIITLFLIEKTLRKY